MLSAFLPNLPVRKGFAGMIEGVATVACFGVVIVMQVARGGIDEHYLFAIYCLTGFVESVDVVKNICAHEQLPVVLVGYHVKIELIVPLLSGAL